MSIADFVGLLLFVAGFVVGLGAVTVIDLMGFLGRASGYWTEAATRAHKVTKPLIWAGIALAVVGGSIFYRNGNFSGIPLYHACIAVVLTLNGMFLSLYVSPFLLRREREGRQSEVLPAAFQKRIAIGLVLSGVGWWGGLVLLVWHVARGR